MNWIQRAYSWLPSPPWRRSVPILTDERADTSTVPQRPNAIRYGSGPAYNVDASMAAFGAFPLVYACVGRKAADLGGLLLRIQRPDGSYASAQDPVLRLLSRPTARGSGVLMRNQAVIDLQLTGTAALRVVGSSGPVPLMSLVRIHPRRTEIQSWPDGQPGSLWWTDDNGVRYGPEVPGTSCILWREPSWRDGAAGVYGGGLIEGLRETLQLDRATRQRSIESATKGRPDAVVRPAGSGSGARDNMSSWSPAMTKQVEETFNEVFSRNHGGVAAVGSAAELTMLGWSPKDMAMVEIGEVAARSILAATGVPAHLIGYPIANTATPRDAERAYWMMLQGLAGLIDDVLSNWLDSIPGYAGCRIEHDFSHVRALQYEQDSAIQRAVALKALGVRADVALEMQGIRVPPGGWRLDPAAVDEPPVAKGDGPPRRPSEGPGMEAPPVGQTPAKQGAQRAVNPMDAPDYAALALLLAGQGVP